VYHDYVHDFYIQHLLIVIRCFVVLKTGFYTVSCIEVVHVGAIHFKFQNSLIDIRYFVVVKTRISLRFLYNPIELIPNIQQRFQFRCFRRFHLTTQYQAQFPTSCCISVLIFFFTRKWNHGIHGLWFAIIV
jgi:hypothetical protein